jgi:hypothetical protein
MAEEALRLIRAVFMLYACHVVGSGVCRKERDILTTLTCANARHSLCELVVWLGVEGNTLEMLATLVAGEALGVEAQASRRDDTSSNRQSTLCAERPSTRIRRRPMRAGIGGTSTPKGPRRMILGVRQWSSRAACAAHIYCRWCRHWTGRATCPVHANGGWCGHWPS